MIGKKVAVLLCLTLLMGCGSSAAKKMSSGGKPLVYPELDEFEQNALLGIGYALEGRDGSKNVSEAKKFATGEQYSAAVSAFEASSLSEDFSDRQAQKDAVVAAAKDVMTKSSGSDEEFEAAYQSLLQAVKSLRTTE